MNTILSLLLIIDLLWRFLEIKRKQPTIMQKCIEKMNREFDRNYGKGVRPETEPWPERKLRDWPVEKMRCFFRKVRRIIIG